MTSGYLGRRVAIPCIRARFTATSSLGDIGLRAVWFDAKLPPHMGEFRGIREAPFRHHLSQRGQSRIGEEESGKPARHIEAHQAAVNQALGRRRQLRLALQWAPSPGPELKAVSNGWQCAEE